MLTLYKLTKYIKNNHQINDLYCKKYIKQQTNLYYLNNKEIMQFSIIVITQKLDITITINSRVKFTWRTYNIFNNIIITKYLMKSIFYILDKYNMKIDNVYINVISGPDQNLSFEF